MTYISGIRVLAFFRAASREAVCSVNTWSSNFAPLQSEFYSFTALQCFLNPITNVKVFSPNQHWTGRRSRDDAAPVVSWPHVCFISPSAPLLPASLLFCSSKADYCLRCPAPTAARAPQHHHHCWVTQEQKRECQTPPTRSLSHWSPHLSSRWGCLFSGFLSTPRVLQMEDPLLPLEPTTQLPLIHLLRRHAPVARARPLSISPWQGVLLKPLTTCFFCLFFSFFLQGSAFRILLHQL